MKKHLVTGGSGFIGAGLVQRLVADGHDVRVLDNGSRGALRRLASIDGQYDYHEGIFATLKRYAVLLLAWMSYGTWPM